MSVHASRRPRDGAVARGEAKGIYLEERERLEAQERVKQEAEVEKKAAAAKQSQKGCAGCLGCFVVVVLFFIIVGSFSSNTGSSGTNVQASSARGDGSAKSASDSDKIGAFVMSQTFVKRLLKSPGSAEFPWYSDSEVTVTDLGGRLYKVSAYVDSQNSFGAKLRTHYVCKLQDLGNQQWQLENIQTDEDAQ